MAAVSKALDDEELAAHICKGLDADYNSVVTSVTARTDPILIPELYAQLLSFETRLELQDGGSYAHMANHGRGNNNRGSGPAHGRGQRGCGQVRGRGSGAPKQRNGGDNHDPMRRVGLMMCRSVRSISKQVTRWPGAGIILMKTMS
jgi:hypothetical protein